MKLINHTFKQKIHTFHTEFNLNKRIVLISDIHFSPKFKREKTDLIINKIKNIKPDYICITGDILDYTNFLEDKVLKDFILKFLSNLASITKTIISIGNHDNYHLIERGFYCKFTYDANKEWFETIRKIDNVILLDNELYEVANISFFGFNPSMKYYAKERANEDIFINELKSNLKLLDKNKYNIILCHTPLHILSPKSLAETEMKNANLVFAGHMHNGMVPPILDAIFKGNKGIFSPDGSWFLKTKLVRGTYHLEDKTLIISSGITKIHDCSPKILIPFNEIFPMSIDIIELK